MLFFYKDMPFNKETKRNETKPIKTCNLERYEIALNEYNFLISKDIFLNITKKKNDYRIYLNYFTHFILQLWCKEPRSFVRSWIGFLIEWYINLLLGLFSAKFIPIEGQ